MNSHFGIPNTLKWDRMKKDWKRATRYRIWLQPWFLMSSTLEIYLSSNIIQTLQVKETNMSFSDLFHLFPSLLYWLKTKRNCCLCRYVDKKVSCRNDFRLSADIFSKLGAGHDLIIVYSTGWLKGMRFWVWGVGIWFQPCSTVRLLIHVNFLLDKAASLKCLLNHVVPTPPLASQ